MFQSTRPRGARLRKRCSLLRTATVSIHAPARGATLVYINNFPIPIWVSIHAPARGATHFFFNNIKLNVCFNPRAREGRDVQTGVSYHYRDSASFNPRAREGRDVEFDLEVFLAGLRFNPRAREGRDWIANEIVDGHWVGFQSTRPRGARQKESRAYRGAHAKVSIHAPARGATTAGNARQTGQGRRFNPRAREGRDLLHLGEEQRVIVSIHAPARGATYGALFCQALR